MENVYVKVNFPKLHKKMSSWSVFWLLVILEVLVLHAYPNLYWVIHNLKIEEMNQSNMNLFWLVHVFSRNVYILCNGVALLNMVVCEGVHLLCFGTAPS